MRRERFVAVIMSFFLHKVATECTLINLLNSSFMIRVCNFHPLQRSQILSSHFYHSAHARPDSASPLFFIDQRSRSPSVLTRSESVSRLTRYAIMSHTPWLQGIKLGRRRRAAAVGLSSKHPSPTPSVPDESNQYPAQTRSWTSKPCHPCQHVARTSVLTALLRACNTFD